MKNKFPSRVLTLLILLIIPLLFFFYYKQKINELPKRADKIPVLYEAPSFKFATQYGDTLTADSLKGKFYVADFIFSSCESVCPNLSKVMAQLQQNFIANPQLSLVSFSIDPARDSAAALRDYAARYGAVRGKWYFLRGDTTQVRTIVENGFKVSVGYAQDSTEAAGYTFTHSSDLLLVDGKGNVRGIYNGVDSADVSLLYNNIGLLIAAKNL
jgi:protein SCO1